MAHELSLETRVSKKDNIIWVLVDKRGKIITENIHKEKVMEFINKKIRLMEEWPKPPRKIETEEGQEPHLSGINPL